MPRIVIALLLCLAGQGALADSPANLASPAIAAAGPPGLLCRQAIEAAARAHAVPPSLLAAIGRVESGRRDPASGATNPWPWTVDAEGQGAFYDTKAQAIAAVRGLQARGIRSIDVGCMQVNLMHHPDAFAGLEQAFDPMANADYASRFLVELHNQAGGWPKATAMYHSTTPELGAAYQQKVMAVWPEEERVAGTTPSIALAHAWAATLVPGAFPPPPPRRTPGVLIIPRSAQGGALPPPGRGLADYRATPVALAWRRP